MRFVVDECTGPAVAAWLRESGHDVISIAEESRGISDVAVLHRAFAENRILITNDKDFGEMIFRKRRRHRGVVFLRIEDERAANKIAVIRRLLELHGPELNSRYVVATDKQIRFAADLSS